MATLVRRGFIEYFGAETVVDDPPSSVPWLYVPGPGVPLRVLNPCREEVPKPQRGAASAIDPSMGLYAPGPGVPGAFESCPRRGAAVYLGASASPDRYSYVPGPGVWDLLPLMEPRVLVPNPYLGVVKFGSKGVYCPGPGAPIALWPSRALLPNW